jgi:hypothetical protein
VVGFCAQDWPLVDVTGWLEKGASSTGILDAVMRKATKHGNWHYFTDEQNKVQEEKGMETGHTVSSRMVLKAQNS